MDKNLRRAGILMPVFSLPGRYGIGSFGREAREFLDFLSKSGQKCWQILPLGPTGYGDSPYQSFSTFAGNPYFIDPDMLAKEGLLTSSELEEACDEEAAGAVDYGRLYQTRWAMLRKAFGRSGHESSEEYHDFCRENEYWLRDYALFMAVKDAHGGKPWGEWESDIASREKEALEQWSEKLSEDIRFYEFLQYKFFGQWRKLKAYANSKDIDIIGDIPIYVSADSADFWAHMDMFLLDERRRISKVAGVPPDGFSADGQLWGNPLYNWEFHRQTGYDWWIRRIEKCRELYDVIRIDHFRGFDEYFAIPASDTTAQNGHWEKGPGIELFDVLKERFPGIRIIAEDLGYMKDSVRKLVRDTGFPNMKVLEFAFDSRDSSSAADYLPYNFDRNCVVYTGTHDNETARGWLDSILPEELESVKSFLAVTSGDPQETVDKLIRMGLSSVADLCIIPLQDYLGLDNSARINHPSTFGTNWKWRVKESQLSFGLSERIRKLTKTYGR